jgi:mitogen-activated protein kinase 15
MMSHCSKTYASSFIVKCENKLTRTPTHSRTYALTHAHTQPTHPQSLTPVPLKALATILPKATPQALDMIEQCIRFDPAKRPTSHALIEHEFVAQFRSPADEIVAKEPLTIAVDDNTKYTAEDYRNKLYKEIKRAKQRSHSQQRTSSTATTPGAATEGGMPAAHGAATASQQQQQQQSALLPPDAAGSAVAATGT